MERKCWKNLLMNKVRDNNSYHLKNIICNVITMFRWFNTACHLSKLSNIFLEKMHVVKLSMGKLLLYKQKETGHTVDGMKSCTIRGELLLEFFVTYFSIYSFVLSITHYCSVLQDVSFFNIKGFSKRMCE